jgi:(E)-4-hydroxy-3-methylbut-2-enyl-diphosphate synthase
VMGCVVNGPGEAAEADIGITGSGQQAVIFKKGRVFKTVPKAKALAALLAEIKKMI